MPSAVLYGHRMHYEEAGSPDSAPIIFLHGNPSSSHSWLGVFDRVKSKAHCIAPDLMGFGQSDKPPIAYSFYNQADYFEAFVEAITDNGTLQDDQKITLVIQDWGSAIGFNYAARHPDKIHGIAFCEAILKPYESMASFPDSDPNNPARQLFTDFRTGPPFFPPFNSEGGDGWKMIVEGNFFLKELFPTLLGLDSFNEVPEEYKKPFPDEHPETRRPIYQLVQDLPIGSSSPFKGQDVYETVAEYADWLKTTDTPMLLLWFKGGPTIKEEHAKWCRDNINNLKEYEFTDPRMKPGTHFFQVTNPKEFSDELVDWFLAIKGGH